MNVQDYKGQTVSTPLGIAKVISAKANLMGSYTLRVQGSRNGVEFKGFTFSNLVTVI